MDSILDYYKKGLGKEVLSILNEFVDKGDVTVKVDGAPALMIWSKIEGLKGPGVSFKLIASQLQKGKPGAYFTTFEEIDSYFAEKGADEHRINAFKEGLKLAKNVKPGIFLWGDTLFSSKSELKKTDDGISCTPNFLEYVFTSDEFKNRIESADFGIYFHTIVDGRSFAARPVNDLSSVLGNNSQFCITPNDLKPKRTGGLENAKKYINELSTKINSVEMTDKDYAALRKAIKTNDFGAFDQEKSAKLISIIETINSLNKELISKYETAGYRTNANGESNDGEGFVISEKTGRVKIVPPEFTTGNIEHMHQKNLKEKFEGSSLVLYSTSKSDDFATYFKNAELKFANNAGNNYGLGIYTTFDTPENSDVGYKDRESIYGNIVYEFVADGTKFICFNYDKFTESPLFSNLGKPSKENFVAVQLKHFGIDLPANELTPNEKLTEPQAVYKFYNLMSTKYYERADGTLKTPVDGIVYYGRNDGYVGIVWSPYNMKLTAKIANGERTKLGISVKYNDVSAEDTIFDGNKTAEKEQVYKLLKLVSANDPKLGTFSNIVIHDNKKIDVVFKALVPALFSMHHAYVILENDKLSQIYKMGYKFGTLDGWVALNYDYSGSFTSEPIKAIQPVQIPDKITGGVFVAKSDLDSTACSRLNKIISRSSGEVILYKCFFTNIDSLNASKITVKTCAAANPDEVKNSKIENPNDIATFESFGDLIDSTNKKPAKAKVPKPKAPTKTVRKKKFGDMVDDAKAKLNMK